jgi:hypothetical protein
MVNLIITYSHAPVALYRGFLLSMPEGNFEKNILSANFAPVMTIEQLKDMKSRLDGLRGFI